MYNSYLAFVFTSISMIAYANKHVNKYESLAAVQIEAMPASEIAEKVRLQNWVKKVILAVAFAVIILFAGLVIAEYADARKNVRGYVDIGEVIIIDNNYNQVGQ